MAARNKGLKFPAEVYSVEELEEFFKTFTNSTTGTRNKCIFLLALRGQLRCAEVLDLRVCDADLEVGAVTVRNGKGSKRRVVGVDRETCRELGKWLEMRPVGGGLMFESHRGRRLCTSYIRKLAKRHGQKAGIKKRMHPHSMRHSGAVKLFKAGVPLTVIKKQLGHSSLAITDTYLSHLGADEVVEAVSRVSWSE